MTCDGNFSCLIVSSTRSLFSKCGIPVPRLAEALALFFLALDAGLPGVLDGERAPRTRDGALERRSVVQVARDHLGAERRQRLRGVTVGFAGHRTQLETAALGEMAQRRASLLTCCTGDQNRLLVCHGEPLFFLRRGG